MPLQPPERDFTVEDAFPEFSFQQPVALVSPPGETNRLFVVEQIGRIKVINNLSDPTLFEFMDLRAKVVSTGADGLTGGEAGLLGMAFHPGYETNRTFFLFYTLNTSTSGRGTGLYDRLSRFEADPEDPNRGDPESEVPLITQFDGDSYHNAGDLHFGPDGYLYVSLGDQGAGYDQYLNSQRIDKNFFSGILRLDVDGRPGSLKPNPHPAVTGPYGIPPDNPFVGSTHFNGLPVPDINDIRTEFYAVGLRNPWRFSFDEVTGRLYANDVGQGKREEINVIVPGGNGGWVAREGHIIHTNRLEDFYTNSFYVSPIADYDRSFGSVIGGGLLYRGRAYSQLYGQYLFTDVASGGIGRLTFSETPLQKEMDRLLTEIEELKQELDTQTAELQAAQTAWEEDHNDPWRVVEIVEATSSEGTRLKLQPDGSLLAEGATPWTDVYTIKAHTDLAEIKSVRLETLPHESLPKQGPGRYYSGSTRGNFILSEFSVASYPVDQPDNKTTLHLKKPRADFSQDEWELPRAVDGIPATGWGIKPEMGQRHWATFQIQPGLDSLSGSNLLFTLKHLHGQGASIGRLRISVSKVSDPVPGYLHEILQIAAGQRTQKQESLVQDYFAQVAPELETKRRELQARQEELARMIRENERSIDWIANEPGIVEMDLHPATEDVLLADWDDGKIKKLVPIEEPALKTLPEQLSETGAFADLETLTPHEGIVPYEVNTPFWSDHAVKRRWFSVPDTHSYITFQEDANWDFPAGSVWIKHFELEMVEGDPTSCRRLETRFLIRNENGVYGVTYRWGDDQTNAYLVPEEGMEETFLVEQADSTIRTQVWHYPSRSECLQCHTRAGGLALGWNSPQMNRSVQVDGRQFNQIAWLHQAGYLQEPPPDPDSLARLADLRDSEAEVEHRVRSYLAANCVQCHQPGGTGRGFWDARFTVPLADTRLIDTAPMDDLGDPKNRLVKPGSLEGSVLYQRVAQLGPHHMPPLATHVVNDQAIDLLADWIQNDLPGSNSGLEITDIRLSTDGWIELALRTEIDREPVLETSTNLEDWEPVSDSNVEREQEILRLHPEIISHRHQFFRLKSVSESREP